MADENFASLSEQREHELVELLSRRWWLPGASGDPELRKTLGRLYTGIVEARRMWRAGRLPDSIQSELAELLKDDPARLRLDAAGELMEEWDLLLVSVGDAEYVCPYVRMELMRYTVEQGTTIATWDQLYGRAVPAALAAYESGREPTDADLELVRSRLSCLLRSRAGLYNIERARTMLRARFLNGLAPILAGVVTAVIVISDLEIDGVSWRTGVLAALAGAMGATVAGAYKLRDELTRINQLRAFRAALAVQPLLGAVAGTFIAFVLESGIISIEDNGNHHATIAVVAFVAGFSEPFLLRTIARVAGEPEPKPPVGSERGRDGAPLRSAAGAVGDGHADVGAPAERTG